ncbi:glutamate racemase [Paucibacter oligotrophus]|uniref:Glutamate racemase n=1 Tax=Roseateles oligotrophus TaxID=1769250 RepID=A0A840L2T1_9BURK|nr:glutamate racemase [Roseateles oligotrophus]
MAAGPASIGVFDSGVGGLTVLRELRRVLPQVPMHYVADAGYAPYGLRTPASIIQRSEAVSEYLIARGARLLVVACNTATAHAIEALRQRWPDIPIVGTEPGIKPAVASTRKGRIGVMATPATIASARFADLIKRHAGEVQVFSQACPGLVELIERGELDTPALHQLLAQLCAPLRAAEVDTVLMGCTHYPLIQGPLQQALGEQVQLLNIESAVAQQAARLWQRLAAGAQDPADPAPPPTLQTTGSAPALSAFVRDVLGWEGLQAQALNI